LGVEFLNILAVQHSERDNEVNSFRRNMAKYRLDTFDEIKDKLPEYLESEPLPKHIPNSVSIFRVISYGLHFRYYLQFAWRQAQNAIN
jgi:hypothetical protein